jgi:hypothetical protein
MQTAEEVLDKFSSYLHYKKRILETSPNDQESTYTLLYEKLSSLVFGFLDNYSSVLLPTQMWLEIEQNFSRYFEEERGNWRIRRTLNIREVDPDVLLALALVSFGSGRKFDGKAIELNSFFTNRVIEYLACEKRFVPALLAKGIILKYGFKPYILPRLEESQSALDEAKGISSRIYEEISTIGRLASLLNAKNVHIVHQGNDWESHQEIENRLTVYHPLNVNG